MRSYAATACGHLFLHQCASAFQATFSVAAMVRLWACLASVRRALPSNDLDADLSADSEEKKRKERKEEEASTATTAVNTNAAPSHYMRGKNSCV